MTAPGNPVRRRVAGLAFLACLTLPAGEPPAAAHDPEAPAAGEAPASIRAEFTGDEVRRILRHSPLPPPPAADGNRVAGDPRAARLGQALFFDRRLSARGDRSCATCHDPHRAFADGRALPEGAPPDARNTPSLVGVAYQRWFYWDGRADSLWMQALEPLEKPSELGAGRERVARLLRDDSALRRAVEEVFGPLPDAADPDATDELFVRAGKALAAYERLLVSGGAPFDRFAEGLREGDEAKLAALAPPARRGLKLFLGRAACASCHAGPAFSDGEFHDVGVPPRAAAPGPGDGGRFDGLRRLLASPFHAAGRWSDDPDGPAARRLRSLVQGEETWGRWRTPTLRHVAATAPYMHQGQFPTLRRVLDHYSTLRGATFGGHHRETVLRPLMLTEDETADLLAFLESLTGEGVPVELRHPPPAP